MCVVRDIPFKEALQPPVALSRGVIILTLAPFGRTVWPSPTNLVTAKRVERAHTNRAGALPVYSGAHGVACTYWATPPRTHQALQPYDVVVMGATSAEIICLVMQANASRWVPGRRCPNTPRRSSRPSCVPEAFRIGQNYGRLRGSD